MQIKAKMRLCLTLIRMTIIRKPTGQPTAGLCRAAATAQLAAVPQAGARQPRCLASSHGRLRGTPEGWGQTKTRPRAERREGTGPWPLWAEQGVSRERRLMFYKL